MTSQRIEQPEIPSSGVLETPERTAGEIPFLAPLTLPEYTNRQALPRPDNQRNSLATVRTGIEGFPELCLSDGTRWLFFALRSLRRAQNEIPFTATGSFAYNHDLGYEPETSVIDSTGQQVEVEVQHLSTSTIALSFSGTLSATLILS